jgi:hypothetical protein
MATPICKLCCDKEDPFTELDWKQIAADVFKSVEQELKEEKPKPVESCQLPDRLPNKPRKIVTGDDTEDDDSDIEQESGHEEDEDEDADGDEEEDVDEEEDEDSEKDLDNPEEVTYYDHASSSLFSGAHQPKRSKANLMQDIRKLYTINQVLLFRMSRLMNKLEQERAQKHKLIQTIQQRLSA